jgi:hypothetical protein
LNGLQKAMAVAPVSPPPDIPIDPGVTDLPSLLDIMPSAALRQPLPIPEVSVTAHLEEEASAAARAAGVFVSNDIDLPNYVSICVADVCCSVSAWD